MNLNFTGFRFFRFNDHHMPRDFMNDRGKILLIIDENRIKPDTKEPPHPLDMVSFGSPRLTT